MTSPSEQNLLLVCKIRCAGLMSDVKSAPRLQDLHRQTKALRGSLRKMTKALRPYKFDSSNLNPTKHPGLSLLASYLFNLRETCGYYGFNTKTEWKLNSEQRASALDHSSNPFARLTKKLSVLAQELKVVASKKHTDSQKLAQDLCEWAESMIDHWDFFKREFGAARGLAAAISATSESREPNPFMTIPGCSAYFHNLQTASDNDIERGQVWDSIGDELAAEGIGDDAIATIAEDLKAYVRDLVQGQRPEVSLTEHESNNHAVQASESVSSEELNALQASSEALLDRGAITSKVKAALNRINTEFNQVANEVLAVALQKDEENETKTFRLVLDLIYNTACRDTARSKALAKLAKHVQKKTTPHIRELMTSKKAASPKAQSGGSTKVPGPVTSWLLGRCREAWTKGKNGSKKFSAEEAAFGLPHFIGELVKAGVLSHYHVHSCIRSKWNATMERDEFVAVYQLLKSAGGICEGKRMDACFKDIASLIENDDTPSDIKALAQELENLRKSKWKSKESEVIDEIQAEMRDSP